LLVVAQQAIKSDADLARQGALALATAHGDKPRYGGKFLSVGNGMWLFRLLCRW